MCDSCENQTPQDIGDELSAMELDYLGSRHGALRMTKVLTGMSNGRIAIGQEIEINSITEDGVTQELKSCVVYLTPELLIEMVDFLAGEDDSSG